MNYLHKNLIKLLNQYIEERKLADEDFIRKAISIILKFDRTEFLLDEISFDIDSYSETLAFYNYNQKKMSFKSMFRNPDREEILNDITEYNVQVLAYIIHECTHILQFKMCLGKSSLETEILMFSIVGSSIYKEMIKNLTIEDLIANIETIYNRITLDEIYSTDQLIYELSPAERMANIRSYRLLEYIYSCLISSQEEILEKIRSVRKNHELRGYRETEYEIISPTIEYLKRLKENHIGGVEELLDELNQTIGLYQFDKRLYTGLPIKINEYQRILKKIV